MQSPPRHDPSPNQSFEVLIIGGGPAGSVAGAWLGQQNRKVLICEKERFPRFHIGESLLPNGNRILQEIGIWEKIKQAGFVEKFGAEFTLPDSSRSVRNVFADGLVKGLDRTYQVERSRFDEILLKHAEESGSQVRQRALVQKIAPTDSGWSIEIKNLDTEETQTIESRWIIDASGRGCVMGRVLGINKEPIPYPGRFAVFNHFEGVPRANGKAGGNINVHRLKDAWFWLIPISDTVTSVGVVAQKGARAKETESREDFFWRKLNESPFLAESLANATATDTYRIESDYCFSYERYGQDQALLAGDAASFIDPVFSSGVYLALESGLLSAKTINTQLKTNNRNVPQRIYARYTRSMKARIQVIRRLIESYYDNKSFEVFMNPQPYFKLPAAINSILAGCSQPPLRVKWRFWLFRKLCELHKKRALAPPIRWRMLNRKTTNAKTRPGTSKRNPPDSQ